MVANRNTVAMYRMYFDYNISGVPHIMFDGGWTQYLGAPYGTGPYAALIEQMGARAVDPVELALSMEWLGDNQIGITVTVRALEDGDNIAPVLAPIGDKDATAGQLLSFGVSASDIDGPAPDLSANGLPSGAQFVDSGNGRGSFSWLPGWSDIGQHYVTFRATDDEGAYDSETIMITVADDCDDPDDDGVCDDEDNCAVTYNPGQSDGDNDGVGDACDNCPENYNPAQDDDDHDGIGDVCESSTGIEDNTLGGLPTRHVLYQNYPNPFNPITAIGFALPRASRVTLDIYDVSGRAVAHLLDGIRSAGNNEVQWQGVDASGDAVGSGVYFYRLQADGFVQTRKMLLLR